jgi:hypothetical protein
MVYATTLGNGTEGGLGIAVDLTDPHVGEVLVYNEFPTTREPITQKRR